MEHIPAPPNTWHRPQNRAAWEKAQEFLDRYHQLPRTDRDGQYQLLKTFFGTVKDRAVIVPPVHIDYGVNIHLGENLYINAGATLLDVAPITIGDHVLIGPNVQLITVSHPIDNLDQRVAGWEYASPITIEDKVWIGAGAIILGGVTIGTGSVIGAGSVVTKDIPPNTVAAGNPARVIRQLDARRAQVEAEEISRDQP